LKNQLEQAIALAKTGDNAKARELLVEVLKSDPTNDTAWVWMAAVVDTLNLRKECLEEALKHNPRNKTARRALERLQARGRVAPSPTEVRARQQRTAAHVLSILSFLFGLLMVGINLAGYQQDLAFQSEGQVIQGRITELYSVIGRGSGDFAKYVYDLNGKRYAGECRVPYRDWKKMQVGQTIKIYYLPSNPEVARCHYENRGDPEESFTYGWIGAGALLLSPVILEGTVLALQAYTRRTPRR
jgi:hypothetical protein